MKTRITFNVAGLAHRFKEVSLLVDTGMDAGKKVKIVPEPDNEHDSHAQKVIYKGEVIGYVPKDVASMYESFVNAKITRLRHVRGVSLTVTIEAEPS